MPIPLDRQHGVRGARAQAVQFYRRERERSLRNVVAKLSRTHELPIANGSVIPAASFDPYLERDIVVRIIASGNGSDSLICGINSVPGGLSGRGVYIGLLGTTLFGSAGAGTGTASDNALVVIANSVAANEVADLSMVVRPGLGRVILYKNGQEIGRTVAPSGGFGTPSRWGEPGEDGDITSGPSTTLSKFEAYAGQHPRRV